MKRRTQRLNDLIRDELANLLLRQVKDPRLEGLITITAVELTPDLKTAKVFVSVLGGGEDKSQVLHGFQAASGYLRRELGHRISLRRVPELAFFQDDSIERGVHLLHLIQEVSKEQAEPGARARPRSSDIK